MPKYGRIVEITVGVSVGDFGRQPELEYSYRYTGHILYIKLILSTVSKPDRKLRVDAGYPGAWDGVEVGPDMAAPEMDMQQEEPRPQINGVNELRKSGV